MVFTALFVVYLYTVVIRVMPVPGDKIEHRFIYSIFNTFCLRRANAIFRVVLKRLCRRL